MHYLRCFPSKGSYVHFHSLYGSLGTIIAIICLIMRMRINVLGHMVRTRSSLLVSHISHLSWLFTIIKSFEHSSIGTTFRKYKVILEDAVLSLTNLGTIDWSNDFGSIILEVLHETSLSIVHYVLRRILLFVWIIESWCSCVWSSAKVWLVHLVLLIHQYYTVILLVTWVAAFKASINCTSNGSSTIRKLTSCLLVWFVESVSCTVSGWFSSSTYSSMISTCSITVSTIWMASLCECSNIHGSIHSIYILEITWSTLYGPFSIMIDINSSIHIVVILITIYWHAVFMLLVDWIACSSVCSLLSQLCLSNCFWDLLIASLIGSWRVHTIQHILIILSRIKELLSCHHHLLLLILASIWSFSLVNQVEQMSLIILRYSIRRSNSIAPNSTWIDAKWAGTISITSVSHLIHIVKMLTSMVLLGIKVVCCHLLLASIALSNVLHKVSIVHRVAHLGLILLSTFLRILWICKSSNTSLIEHLLFIIHLTIDMRKHLMDPRVICWLKQYTMMSCVHFIDRQRPVPCSIASSLFSHSISHKECLIRFLSSEPILKIMVWWK